MEEYPVTTRGPKPEALGRGEVPDIKWRVIATDSDSDSGVAPVCPRQREEGWQHDRRLTHPVDHVFGARWDETGVYDCCPHPHLECWGARKAMAVRDVLNSLAVEVCS